MTDTRRPGPLEGIRVLDLAGPLAEATGRVLADLGAEVVKVEPPGGCASRFTAPFEDGREGDADGSLFWRAWGLGKKSVVLDLHDAGDRERFLALADGADVLIESFTPGAMEALGLHADALLERNPALVYVSVTPFGQTGPEAKSPATDLTISAAGGLMDLQGDGDRPPLPVGHPEASCHAAVQAAADALLALWGRQRDGRGQHLDASMQAAVVWTLLFATGFSAMQGQEKPGAGESRGTPTELFPGVAIPDRARTKDGFAVMTLVLGEVGAKSFGSMMRWAAECGGLDEDLAGHDWSIFFQLLGEGKLAAPDIARGFEQFVAFLGTRTKAEIQERALAESWLIGPAWDAAELLADPQLAARDYWTDVAGTTHCGPFAKLSATPIVYRGPAPALGADQALVDAPQRTPAAPLARVSETRASLLEGLKVADFSWVGAGPLVSKDLANLGATVVHVESEKHVDPLRVIPPWTDGVPNLSTGHTAANFNQSKLGLALDLNTDGGREAALRLVDWADVVVESFTPGTAARLGLDYATLRQRRPDVVMLSSCMRGQTGPEAAYTGFGLQGAGLAGFVAITGWPDRLPSGPWGAYTDFIAPRFSLAALAAALHHRDRTGEGQYVDLSQIEAALHFIEPVVLDYTVNGRVTGLRGLDSDRACPHGAFPAAGVHRYVAIAVETPEQWRALQERVPALESETGCEALDARLARKARLEEELAAWCAGQEPFALAESLRRAGVPAWVVMRGTDLHRDPQLLARDFFVELDHPRIGPMRYDGAVTRFSRTPARPTRAGPSVGQDTFEVMSGILGYGDEEIAELAGAGGLGQHLGAGQ
ncbi:MAG: CaiB/BaiF CoA transferase family protein, partial [Myxococcota bacterium]